MENLLQHGFFTGGNTFRKYSPTFVWGPLQVAMYIFVMMYLSLWDAEEPLLWHPEHFLPLLLHWPQCSQGCFSYPFFLAPYYHAAFLPLLKYTSPKEPPPCLRGSAMSCSGWVGAGWNQLCLAWGSPGLSSQRSLQPPPATNTWVYTHNMLKLKKHTTWLRSLCDSIASLAKPNHYLWKKRVNEKCESCKTWLSEITWGMLIQISCT